MIPIPNQVPNMCVGHIKHKRPTVDGQNLAQVPGEGHTSLKLPPPTPPDSGPRGGPHESQAPPSRSPGLNVVGRTSTDGDPEFLANGCWPVDFASANIKLVWVSGEARL